MRSARRRRALVADDEESLRALLAGHLEDSFSVLGVPDGQRALDAARAERFDVVLLDIMMPGLNGLDACRALGSLDDPPPVLLISALDSPDDRIEGLLAGAEDVLAKPVHRRELCLRVERIVARREREAASRAFARRVAAARLPLHELQALAAVELGEATDTERRSP